MKINTQSIDNESVATKQALACLAKYLPSDTIAFIESQVTMSQQSKMGYRWNPKDKMIALSKKSLQNSFTTVHFAFQKHIGT